MSEKSCCKMDLKKGQGTNEKTWYPLSARLTGSQIKELSERNENSFNKGKLFSWNGQKEKSSINGLEKKHVIS